MDQIKGAQSIMFREAPYLISAASVAGSKEADGPIGKLFDVTDKDDLFGAQTWEEAESNMQKEACVLAAGKAHVDLKKIRYLFGGDLLRQGIATSMGVEALQIPMFGLYGACSTSGEALALASMSAAAGYGGTMIAVTSSHFGSAEKEFRFPLGYANQRPLSSHWTVTGSGAFLVQSAEEYSAICNTYPLSARNTSLPSRSFAMYWYLRFLKASSSAASSLSIQQALYRLSGSQRHFALYSFSRRYWMTSNCNCPTVPIILRPLNWLTNNCATPSSINWSIPLASCFCFIGSAFSMYLNISGEKLGSPLK